MRDFALRAQNSMRIYDTEKLSGLMRQMQKETI